MGLAQKRIASEYSTTVFPGWKSEIDAIAGFEVPMEVKWDTMQNEEYSDRGQYFEWYPMVYFKPLKTALQAICSDNMGKEALKTALKKIVIDGSEGSNPGNSSFENGVLTIRHKFNSNVDDTDSRAKAWTKMLEDKL